MKNQTSFKAGQKARGGVYGESQKRMIAILKNRHVTVRMLCRELVLPETTVGAALSRMKKAGIVKMHNRDSMRLAGVYSIVQDDENPFSLADIMAVAFGRPSASQHASIEDESGTDQGSLIP